jgi:hypothetical protein
MEILKGSTLYFRVEFMKLHNKVWQLSSVKDLKGLIASTDSLVDELESCSEDSAAEMMWGSMRHKAVGQVAVGMLKEKVRVSAASLGSTDRPRYVINRQSGMAFLLDDRCAFQVVSRARKSASQTSAA